MRLPPATAQEGQATAPRQPVPLPAVATAPMSVLWAAAQLLLSVPLALSPMQLSVPLEPARARAPVSVLP